MVKRSKTRKNSGSGAAEKKLPTRLFRKKKFDDQTKHTVIIQSLLNRSITHHRAGRLSEAAQLYQQVLELEPNHPEALHLLGVVAHQSGQFSTAIDLINAAIALKPGVAEYYLNLGVANQESGNLSNAIVCYERALELNPSLSMVHNNLANIFREQARHSEALKHSAAALEIEPSNPVFLCNQAAIWIDSGELDQAKVQLQKAVEIDPKCSQAYCSLALIETHNDNSLHAMELYQIALQHQPNFALAWTNLAQLLLDQGAVDQAKSAFRQSFYVSERVHQQFRADTSCPVILKSQHELDVYRDQLNAMVRKYDGDELQLAGVEWGSSGLAPPFYLSYHGHNDKELKVKWANLFAKKIRPLTAASRNGQVHVGFVVADRHVPVFWRFMGGFVRQLPSHDLRLSIVGSHSSKRHLATYPIPPSVDVIAIPNQCESAANLLHRIGFDVLFYFEPEADAFNYFLPFFRPASVQCTSWGNPVTSGIPQMTDFLSSMLIEPANAQSHYSEQLWQFNRLPVYYPRPFEFPKLRREHFGLRDGDHIYGCTQSLFKLVPEFDHVFAEILRADPRGRVVLIEGRHKYWTNLLKQRFSETISDVATRIVFLPHQAEDAFRSLLACCDVLLDSHPFSGGATTYEAMAVGTPTVSLPADMMRGRVTMGCWLQMGIDDTIASNQPDYVAKAVGIATCKDRQTDLRKRILQANADLFEDKQAVGELHDWLLNRAMDARN
ncbi:MAG TPA: tetratricopeptide repeat protein [Pirellulaceae bacterium]|nr:tetratricopeptide repeat protein [Pirellulaceae bacterium]HMO92772.1 tetratricopeptide repeat protein [Pirellulaceae bacterium]HMP69354.1 tetratricopeptide repeat protein [Pirellulaceae bacterium]